ncbi:hypothetical protein SDC9_203818 [bioreactor metagenome]|uniref:Uncharacterized protein n=1 Tax=bioreactor metagenome TaxID=1076179 RepID=A0A645IZ50_9ZZZZ
MAHEVEADGVVRHLVECESVREIPVIVVSCAPAEIEKAELPAVLPEDRQAAVQAVIKAVPVCVREDGVDHCVEIIPILIAPLGDKIGIPVEIDRLVVARGKTARPQRLGVFHAGGVAAKEVDIEAEGTAVKGLLILSQKIRHGDGELRLAQGRLHGRRGGAFA